MSRRVFVFPDGRVEEEAAGGWLARAGALRETVDRLFWCEELGTYALALDGEETELLVGDPVTGILDSARHWEADLVVVGTHSRGALERFFLGSTAAKVVERSPIPVLTIRTPHA